MRILIVGVGYVGLVTAACFAEMGHEVVCLDIDHHKIAGLRRGEIPIFEPGLKELVLRNSQAGRLHFTTSYAEALPGARVCFICVATPSKPDGACDITYVLSAITTLAKLMQEPLLVVNKSTVPVGTSQQAKETIQTILDERGLKLSFDVVSNPEFLKEGNAIQDCMKPDRIILGVESKESEKLLREIYSAFTVNHDRIIVMDNLSAELTKYAANAMLATRISFMNELSTLCEQVGANINQIRLGIGSDQRIGFQFLYAGAGYGGSCFPKDIRALISTAKQQGIHLSILNSVEEANEKQKNVLGSKVIRYFSARGGLSGRTIAIWGLSFKPDTDDLREAPSLSLIETLLQAGCVLRLYDPVAMEGVKKIYPHHAQITFCQDEYDAAKDADAIVLVTDWKQFRFVNLDRIKALLRHPAFFDGRNQYEPAEMLRRGFDYAGIGIPEHQSLSSILDKWTRSTEVVK